MAATVGICAIEAYFPATFVGQEDLEAANAVSKGKYTIGLGQDAMAFTGDCEDINSVCLTVVQSLLEKYGIAPHEVGRLEVGTETLVDKSKSTKTVLMSLFPGNNDIEGATVVNACYGGTAALLNALTWCDSSGWDGRFAIVVAGDIAVYAEGPARPTGGCGAVAMLIGRNAPIAINLKTRATYAAHTWDFYKPKMDSDYPEVDGTLSETCYLRALDDCYTRHLEKKQAVHGKAVNEVGLGAADHVLFHSPYNKLVQKSLARLFFLDVRAGRPVTAAAAAAAAESADVSQLRAKWGAAPLEQTYKDKDLETALKAASAAVYADKVAPGCAASKLIGNTYTASVWLNLACLVSTYGAALAGRSVTLFSYGSGALATMLELSPSSASASASASASTSAAGGREFSLARMQQALDLAARLQSREQLLPAHLSHALEARERLAHFAPYSPQYLTDSLFPGTFYLQEISAKGERVYARKGAEAVRVLGGIMTRDLSAGELAVFAAAAGAAQGRARLSSGLGGGSDTDDLSLELANQIELNGGGDSAGGAFWLEGRGPEISGRLRGGSEESVDSGKGSSGGLGLGLGGNPNSPQRLEPEGGGSGMRRPMLRSNKTFVWASGRPNVKVVVTGVAAALPGRDSAVFTPGVNNVYRIIRGENCITNIPAPVQSSMLEKNVCLLKKNKDGSQTKVPVERAEDSINVCASLGEFSLTSYGVPESIASTMDRSVQVAVAAGLEALKDAGIVTGEGEGLSGWELPASMQDTTGVVYATSFPALDTAIAEVSRFFATKTVQGQHIPDIVTQLRARLQGALGGVALSEAHEKALQDIADLAQEAADAAAKGSGKQPKPYEFDRKFLFRVLVLGNAQLAQIIKARGPNMQTNAACAGSTQAVALAYDMIQVGRAERMVLVAGDNAASDTLMPWLGNGFRALGAATICSVVSKASVPFDKSRSGMILGAGGIGMVLESEQGALRRHALAQSLHPPESLLQAPGSGIGPPRQRPPFKCRLLGTLISNSAYHGASLDREHIAAEMERFVASVEKEQGVSRSDIAKHGVYFSHETSTYSSPTSSCASNEVYGLRKVFGADFQHLLILNTKGFTGHPMGVSFEDVVAAEVLVSGQVPPIANRGEGSETDPNLLVGGDIKLSRGGAYPCRYAMRFAAGFGSQVALAIYGAAWL